LPVNQGDVMQFTRKRGAPRHIPFQYWVQSQIKDGDFISIREVGDESRECFPDGAMPPKSRAVERRNFLIMTESGH
jgi:hypothetical protein